MVLFYHTYYCIILLCIYLYIDIDTLSMCMCISTIKDYILWTMVIRRQLFGPEEISVHHTPLDNKSRVLNIDKLSTVEFRRLWRLVDTIIEYNSMV